MQRLNEFQIEELYKFTRKHFVEWYDVQTELVDHLANGIEMQLQENPNLTFDEALNKEFKKFGIFGFSDLLEQKTNALSKYYFIEVLKHVKEYFKIPKIVFTLFSIWFLFELMKWFENKNFFVIPIILTVFLYVLIYAFKEQKRIKTNYKNTGKKWLFESIHGQFGGLIHLYNIGIYMPLISNSKDEWSLLSQFIFSFCVVLYIIFIHVSTNVVAPKLKEKYSKEHPQYKID